jgi:hypothetical protein
MFTKTALTAAIIFGTASVALAAEFDANQLNRYQGYTSPKSAPAFHSRDVSMGGSQVIIRNDQRWLDRASEGYGF